MVRSALVQPDSDDHLRDLRISIPDQDTAVFNELAKAVTMAIEPWLREALGREVLADTSALRLSKKDRVDEKPRPMHVWQVELIGDVNELLLVRVPESNAQYLAGGQVADEKEAALTSLIAGWTRLWFATIARLLDWQIDTHTRYADGNSDAAGDTPFRDGQEQVAVLTCGWTFADGGVSLMEYWMPISLVQKITQRLCPATKQKEPGAYRSLREGVVRTYRPERALRAGYAPVLPVEFPPLEEVTAKGRDNGIELVRDVVLNVAVELAKTELKIGDLLEIKIGDILRLGKMAGEPMEVSLNGEYIARGEVLVLDDRLGIRINEIIDRADLLESAQR